MAGEVALINAGVNLIGSLLGGGGRKPDDPYTIPCGGGMTVTQNIVNAARSASLPGQAAFDGKGGWSTGDCARIVAYAASQSAPVANPYVAPTATAATSTASTSGGVIDGVIAAAKSILPGAPVEGGASSTAPASPDYGSLAILAGLVVAAGAALWWVAK